MTGYVGIGVHPCLSPENDCFSEEFLFILMFFGGGNNKSAVGISKYIPIGSMYGIFTHIYHKNQPVMYINIPFVPWKFVGFASFFVDSPDFVLIKPVEVFPLFSRTSCSMERMLFTCCAAFDWYEIKNHFDWF